MAVPRTIQKLLEKGDFDGLEDTWLGHMAEAPDDVGFFVGVARALVGIDEEERARFLLGMLDSELIDQGHWHTRLELLERSGSLLMPPEELHPAILETLRQIHGDRPSCEELIEAAGLHRAPHDLPKTWEKVERFESLVVFDVGAVVTMDKHGVGRVADINLELKSFKIDFEDHPGLTVGFRAAPKVLEPLPEEHILRRKLEEPEALRRLGEEDPAELLRIVLESYEEPRTAGQIRQDLAGVVDEGSWSSWWSRARKHPQVVAGTGGRQSYDWIGSQAGALEAVWQTFLEAAPRKRLDLLRRDGSRDGKLARRMAESLLELAGERREEEPGLAFEIAVVLEREGLASAEAEVSATALVDTVPAKRLFGGVVDRSVREEGYRMLRERLESWQEAYLELLAQEQDPRALDVLADALEEKAAEAFGRFLDGLLAQPDRAPAAFVWMAERAGRDETLRERNPLRLLQHVLQAFQREEFKAFRSRLKPMVESGGTVPRLLSHLSTGQAAKAEQQIYKAGGLEGYQREDLMSALHLRFPELREGGGEAERLYALPDSIEAKRREFETLIKKELPANRKAIEEARALGDLRENFEYKSARQRHEYLSTRASELEADLARVQPIGEVEPGIEEVRIGTRVRLAGDGGKRELTILGPWESDPDRDIISYQSDLAGELLGKSEGEEIAISGDSYRIVGIEPWQ